MIPEMREKLLHGLRPEVANFWMKKQEIYGVGNWRVHAAKLPMATVLFIPEETLGKPEITYELDGAEAVCKFPGYDQSFRFHTYQDQPDDLACDSPFYIFNRAASLYFRDTHAHYITRTPSRATDTEGLFMFTFTKSKAQEGRVVCGQLLDDELANGLIRIYGLPFPRKEITAAATRDILEGIALGLIGIIYKSEGRVSLSHPDYRDPFGVSKDLEDI